MEKAKQEDNLLDHLSYILLDNLMEEDSILNLVRNYHFNLHSNRLSIHQLRELVLVFEVKVLVHMGKVYIQHRSQLILLYLPSLFRNSSALIML